MTIAVTRKLFDYVFYKKERIAGIRRGRAE